MVKHNKIIPNQHFHKKWAGGANGKARGPLHVVTWFDQPAKKKGRRLRRAAKAAKMAPRPTGGLLRPVVRCPTIKYNTKTRLGRGFSVEELKEAGIPVKFARTIGIAVDLRRNTKSNESLQANVQRLQEYKAKLVLFPRKKLAAPKKSYGIDEATPAQQAEAAQLSGAVMPIQKAVEETQMMPVTDEMKSASMYTTLRQERMDARILGTRIRMKKEKEAAEAEKKK